MTWHTERMALLDFETTGTDPFRDRVVSAAVIKVGGGHRTVERAWLINPGIEIPEAATAVHGITNEQAGEGQDPASAIVEILGPLNLAINAGIPIVGHNVVYDLTMLWAELVRHGHDALAEKVALFKPVVDTQVIEKHLDPYRPKVRGPKTRRPEEACGSHQLTECCRLWGIELSAEDAHGAAADAMAAGRLAWRLATDPMRFAQYDWGKQERIAPATMNLVDLHTWQTEQYAAEAARFQSYKRGEERKQPDEIEPDFVANTRWPVQAAPADWTPDQLPAVAEAVASS